MDRLSERKRVQVHPPYRSIRVGTPQGGAAGGSFPWTRKDSKVVWATAHVMWVLKTNKHQQVVSAS